MKRVRVPCLPPTPSPTAALSNIFQQFVCDQPGCRENSPESGSIFRARRLCCIFPSVQTTASTISVAGGCRYQCKCLYDRHAALGPRGGGVILETAETKIRSRWVGSVSMFLIWTIRSILDQQASVGKDRAAVQGIQVNKAKRYKHNSVLTVTVKKQLAECSAVTHLLGSDDGRHRASNQALLSVICCAN